MSRLNAVLQHLNDAEANLLMAAKIVGRADDYVEKVLQETPETHQVEAPTANDPVIPQIKSVFGQWKADLEDEVCRVAATKNQVLTLINTVEKNSAGE
ncbi:MAG: hypothetical protein V1807_01005 [Patescibacteria group bacterium]